MTTGSRYSRFVLSYGYFKLVFCCPLIIYILVEWNWNLLPVYFKMRTSVIIYLVYDTICTVIRITACHKKFVRLIKVTLICDQIWLIPNIGVSMYVVYMCIDFAKFLINSRGHPEFTPDIITVFILIPVNALVHLTFLQVFVMLTVKTVLKTKMGNTDPVARCFSIRRTLLGFEYMKVVLFVPSMAYALFKSNLLQDNPVISSILVICLVVDLIFTIIVLIACHKKIVAFLEASVNYHKIYCSIILVGCICSVGRILYMLKGISIAKQLGLIVSILILMATVIFLQLFIILTIDTVLKKTQQVPEDRRNTSEFRMTVVHETNVSSVPTKNVI